MISAHPWRVRMGIALIMFTLAFLGLILMTAHEQWGWHYWKYVTPLFGILCISLSIYLRRGKHINPTALISHEIFHWLGLLAFVYLISTFVDRGLMVRFGASLSILILIAFSVYISGVYIEKSLIVIGLTLGLFSAVVSFLAQYIYFLIIPLILMAFLAIHFTTKKKSEIKSQK